MRKVLLASTALFALGSVSAMAADITISGGFELGYDSESDQSDGSRISSETDWNVMFSNTTDSGITTSLNYGFDESGGVDDQNYSISGDFGTIAVANSADGDDGAVDGMDEEAGTVDENSVWASHTSNYGSNYSGGWAASYGTGDRLSYTLPSLMDGLTVAITHLNETGAESFAYGAKYAMGPVTVSALKMAGHRNAVTAVAHGDGVAGRAAAAHSEIEGSHFGASVAVGGATIAMAQNKYEESDGTAGDMTEGKGTRMGVAYPLGDITLGYESVKAEWDNAAGTAALDTYKYDSFGAAYSIATGITAKIAITEGEIQNDADETTMDTYNTTRLSVSVSF